MASLTPGVLSKLLNNVANKDVKVTGDHRSALLQVIEILPSLASSDDHDPWKSRGFFLKISDSKHAAYVSIAENDLDLIYNDKIQLGQFVYVTRLDSASPVPVLRGLKPVPSRKPCPCVGNPVDLVSSDLLNLKGNGNNFNFSRSKSKAPKNNAKSVNDSVKTRVDSRNVRTKPKGTNLGLDCAVKSMSTGNVVAKRVVKNEDLESRRLSLDSARRAWGHTTKSDHGALQRTTSHFKSKLAITDKKVSPKSNSTPRCPIVSISPLKNKNETSPFINVPANKELKAISESITPSRCVKVPCFKTLSEQRTSWDVLPPVLNDLGKQIVHHRNAAVFAAVCSLEEASTMESVLNCMSMFAELCASSEKTYAGLLVKKFLDLNKIIWNANTAIGYLMNTRLYGAKSNGLSTEPCCVPDDCRASTSNCARSWIEAAVGTNLSKFDLFKVQDKDKIPKGETCHYIVLETTPAEPNVENCSPLSKVSPRNHASLSPSQRFCSSTRKMNAVRVMSKGIGLKDASNLAEKLLLVSREWFLNYLEDSTKKGFGLNRDKESLEVTSLLGQLKRVNHWLDGLVVNVTQEGERIESLRKKLYGFLLDHVDSAVVFRRKDTQED